MMQSPAMPMMHASHDAGAGAIQANRFWSRCLGAQRLGAVMLLVTLIVSNGACVSDRVVFGNVPPSTFQFATVIEHEGPEAGGWRAAQVAILLGYLSAFFPRDAVCDVEVGVPIVNHRGYVSVRMAQQESADASDRAAREIMQKRVTPTASACYLFRETMQTLLNNIIPGATVTEFRLPGLPRRTFPVSRGGQIP